MENHSRVLAVSGVELGLGGGELVHAAPRVHPAVHPALLHLLRREHRRLVVHDELENVKLIAPFVQMTFLSQ